MLAISHPSTDAMRAMAPDFERATGMKVVWEVGGSSEIMAKQGLAQTARDSSSDVLHGVRGVWDLAAALPFTRAAGHVERYLDASPLRIEALLAGDHGFPLRQPMIVGPEDTVERLLDQFYQQV